MSKHQIIHFKHAVNYVSIMSQRRRCLDTSELCRLGELLTFPSVIFLITERTINHTEDGGEACGRPTA